MNQQNRIFLPKINTNGPAHFQYQNRNVFSYEEPTLYILNLIFDKNQFSQKMLVCLYTYLIDDKIGICYVWANGKARHSLFPMMQFVFKTSP